MRKQPASFLSHLYIDAMILPRQARVKQRESTQKPLPFSRRGVWRCDGGAARCGTNRERPPSLCLQYHCYLKTIDLFRQARGKHGGKALKHKRRLCFSIFALSPGGSVEQCARGVVVSGSGRVVANAKTIHSSATVSGTAVKGNEECGIIGQCADIRQHNQTRIARQCLACRVLARRPLLQL
jgi:hypothetical protein